MTYEAEVAKEYLRKVFTSGSLDVTRDYETVRGFVQIFAGEIEALQAIDQARFLDVGQRRELIKLANPNEQTARQYRAWMERVFGADNAE